MGVITLLPASSSSSALCAAIVRRRGLTRFSVFHFAAAEDWILAAALLLLFAVYRCCVHVLCARASNLSLFRDRSGGEEKLLACQRWD